MEDRGEGRLAGRSGSEMEFEYIVGGKSQRISLERKGESFVLRYGERILEADVRVVSPHAISLLVGGRSHLVYIAEDKDRIFVSLGGTTHVLKRPGAEERRFERGDEGAEEGKTLVTAPMPGKVVWAMYGARACDGVDRSSA